MPWRQDARWNLPWTAESERIMLCVQSALPPGKARTAETHLHATLLVAPGVGLEPARVLAPVDLESDQGICPTGRHLTAKPATRTATSAAPTRCQGRSFTQLPRTNAGNGPYPSTTGQTAFRFGYDAPPASPRIMRQRCYLRLIADPSCQAAIRREPYAPGYTPGVDNTLPAKMAQSEAGHDTDNKNPGTLSYDATQRDPEL